MPMRFASCGRRACRARNVAPKWSSETSRSATCRCSDLRDPRFPTSLRRGTFRDVKPEVLAPSDTFARRHIGPSRAEVAEMLAALGYKSLDELTAATIPSAIALGAPLQLGEPLGEHEMIEELK